jgi:hypothetical protein
MVASVDTYSTLLPRENPSVSFVDRGGGLVRATLSCNLRVATCGALRIVPSGSWINGSADLADRTGMDFDRWKPVPEFQPPRVSARNPPWPERPMSRSPVIGVSDGPAIR